MVGETYSVYMLVQDTNATNSTLTDVVRINWDIMNGPTAAVSVLDMYTNSNSVILKDF
jgi:hypothetical protein